MSIQKLEPRVSIVTLLVRDLARSHRFDAEGLGFPTTRDPASEDWIGFRLNGICQCLYPYAKIGAENLERRLDVDRAIDR